MANVIDEMTGPVNTQGRDINVIEKQIPVKTVFGSVLFEFSCGSVYSSRFDFPVNENRRAELF